MIRKLKARTLLSLCNERGQALVEDSTTLMLVTMAIVATVFLIRPVFIK